MFLLVPYVIVGNALPKEKLAQFGTSDCKKFNKMRKPGIEPGARRWQRRILPLNHMRLVTVEHNL
jgi:hypothetical protein